MAGEQGVKLLGAWFSPFAQRVELALKLKGVKYVAVEEDIFNKSPLLLKSNPVLKKIPVLLHNEKSICESLVIVEYIDETWKLNPILPQDPSDKAVARFWAKYIDEKLIEVIRKILFSKAEEQEEAVKQAKEALEVLEEEVKGKKLFGGDTIGLIDITLGWISLWLGVIEEASNVQIFDSEKFPCLAKWVLNYLEYPFVKETMPPRDQLADFFKNFRWKKRFNVAVRTAEGLAYLHHECLEWVIYCDVKPVNILLDSEFESKISDFGLAKLSPRGKQTLEASRISGTKGYTAPK
ncbi:probable glutathione S-transferase [Pistacia vera]|uniref:probable glutathione S-transferase n=1 Tax=Pistacia vera TaxID=55513 RepID=UPI001262DAF4|nr:probable glutathione S-transferase [Pistacia vera]